MVFDYIFETKNDLEHNLHKNTTKIKLKQN